MIYFLVYNYKLYKGYIIFIIVIEKNMTSKKARDILVKFKMVVMKTPAKMKIKERLETMKRYGLKITDSDEIIERKAKEINEMLEIITSNKYNDLTIRELKEMVNGGKYIEDEDICPTPSIEINKKDDTREKLNDFMFQIKIINQYKNN